MKFILTEGNLDLVAKMLKRVYFLDYYIGDFEHYYKENNMFMKTLFYDIHRTLKEITLKYIKNTNNIFEIIYLK